MRLTIQLLLLLCSSMSGTVYINTYSKFPIMKPDSTTLYQEISILYCTGRTWYIPSVSFFPLSLPCSLFFWGCVSFEPTDENGYDCFLEIMTSTPVGWYEGCVVIRIRLLLRLNKMQYRERSPQHQSGWFSPTSSIALYVIRLQNDQIKL